jgi:hypothetical protein
VFAQEVAHGRVEGERFLVSDGMPGADDRLELSFPELGGP